MLRRTLLANAASAVGLGVGLAGCSDAPLPPESPATTDTTPSTTAEPTDEPGSTDWTATTDCEPMRENVVKIEWVVDDLDDEYSPVPFDDLTAGERDLIRTVVTAGGYSSCAVTDSFRRFVDRVMTHRREQDRFTVYLSYDEEYYGLYVQQGDQVFSSG